MHHQENLTIAKYFVLILVIHSWKDFKKIKEVVKASVLLVLGVSECQVLCNLKQFWCL